MQIKLNKTEKIGFPSTQKWAEFYVAWMSALMNLLGSKYGEADCRDAIAFAFDKIMNRKKLESYKRVPETEAEWFSVIWWQAKHHLLHLSASRATRERHHRKAFQNGMLTLPSQLVCTIDKKIRAKALQATFKFVCEEAHLTPRNVEAYVRRYLNDESSEVVARSLGMTANNLYVVCHRIEKLLSTRGKKTYWNFRRQYFLDAV